MSTINPKAQALLEAQIKFIEAELSQKQTIIDEFMGFFEWFTQQKVGDLWQHAEVTALLQEQILNSKASTNLITLIEQHIALALEHPDNVSTKIDDVLDVNTVDEIAQYIASKTEHRKALIKQLVNNSAYVELMTNIVQQSIKDFMDNTMLSKKVPGMGSLMKVGKSVLERASDNSFDDNLRNYLHKNFSKISNLSERLINQYLDNNKVYHLQAKFWHSIKVAPLSSVKNYILVEDLPHTVGLGHKIWDHLRQTEYLQEQVSAGVTHWLNVHQNETFAKVLTDINVDQDLLRSELADLCLPIIEKLVSDGYLSDRIRFYLMQFYASDEVNAILQIE